jgi:hypothetical protein
VEAHCPRRRGHLRGHLLKSAQSARGPYPQEMMKMISVKKAARREYTRDEVKALKTHSKARTPIVEVSKQMKRTVPALRSKAHELGIGLGQRR